MGSLGVQLCHRCCFLRVRTLLTAFQRDRTLRSRSLRVSLARAQGGLLSVNPHRAVRLERWRGDHLSVLSSRRASQQPADETAVAASPGSHLLPYENCHLEDTVRSDPTPERPLVELDAVPPPSPFEEITDEDASQISVDPGLSPVSVSLRDYVNQSETLRRLVLLGVDLSKLERRPNVGNMLLRLDFEKDVQERLLFLRDVGVEEMHLGPVLTINPFILTENMKNLQARVSYLRLKRFSADAIARMVSKAPHLLNFSVERLDNRLSFFQKQLELNVQKTQDLVTRFPRLLCGKLDPVKENLKVCEMDLGFRKNEVQHMVTRVPKLLTTNKKKLTGIFDYVHNTMGIPHSLIVRFPQVLNARLLRIRERHLFLKHLGRDQFDLAEPNYVSLDQLVSLPDHLFCATIALASLEDFDVFQKTL